MSHYNKYNASLLNKNINFVQKKKILLTSNVWKISVCER